MNIILEVKTMTRKRNIIILQDAEDYEIYDVIITDKAVAEIKEQVRAVKEEFAGSWSLEDIYERITEGEPYDELAIIEI